MATNWEQAASAMVFGKAGYKEWKEWSRMNTVIFDFPRKWEYVKFMTYLRQSHKAFKTAAKPYKSPLVATWCGHQLHPGDSSPSNKDICPVCRMRECNDSLKRIFKVVRKVRILIEQTKDYGRLSNRYDDDDTMIARFNSFWRYEKFRWANLKHHYEEVADQEKVWEESDQGNVEPEPFYVAMTANSANQAVAIAWENEPGLSECQDAWKERFQPARPKLNHRGPKAPHSAKTVLFPPADKLNHYEGDLDHEGDSSMADISDSIASSRNSHEGGPVPGTLEPRPARIPILARSMIMADITHDDWEGELFFEVFDKNGNLIDKSEVTWAKDRRFKVINEKGQAIDENKLAEFDDHIFNVCGGISVGTELDILGSALSEGYSEEEPREESQARLQEALFQESSYKELGPNNLELDKKSGLVYCMSASGAPI